MGSRLKTAGSQSLYQTVVKYPDALNAEAEATKSNVLVNCASKEYFSVVDLTTLEIPVVTPVFMENKSGKAKLSAFMRRKREVRCALSCRTNSQTKKI